MVGDRVVEVADITAWPVIAVDGYQGLAGRYPWLRDQPDRVLQLVPGEGGARILGGQPMSPPPGTGAGLLGRVWRCPRRDCPSFGERRATSQAVPRLRSAVPVCPRHDEPLINAGTKPPFVTMAVMVDGIVRERFVVRLGRTGHGGPVAGRPERGDDRRVSERRRGRDGQSKPRTPRPPRGCPVGHGRLDQRHGRAQPHLAVQPGRCGPAQPGPGLPVEAVGLHRATRWSGRSPGPTGH